jgi:hypothetical protein
MGRTETDRKVTNELRSSMRRGENRTTKTTLWSERSSTLKKDLTGPTLLETSGYAGGRRNTHVDPNKGIQARSAKTPLMPNKRRRLPFPAIAAKMA